MKSKKVSKLFSLTSTDQTLDLSKTINQDKVLVGLAPQCDFQLAGDDISHYHALIIFNSTTQHLKIVDLHSQSGIFVNSKKIQESALHIGDHVVLGHQEFIVMETEGKFTQVEASVPSLEPVTIPSSTSVPSKDNQVDDTHNHFLNAEREINKVYKTKFDEQNFTPIDESPIDCLHGLKDHYIDTATEESILESTKIQTERSLEISILSSGNIIDVQLIPIKNNSKETFYISSKKKRNTILLETLDQKKYPFIQIQNGNIHIHSFSDFEFTTPMNVSKEALSLAPDQYFILTHKTVQVIIRNIETPISNKLAPFLGGDKKFQREIALKFMAIFLPLLLLNFFIPEDAPPPKKKIAIVYKKKKESSTSLSSGQQLSAKPEAPKQIVKPKQKVAKKTPRPIKPQKTPVKPKVVAKTKPRPTPKPVVKKKTKAFKLTNKKSFASLFKKSSFVASKTAASNSRSPSSFNSQNSVQTYNPKGTGKSSKALKLGSVYSQGLDTSVGPNGRGKKGNGKDYINSRTVVLGSMDPELLRRILKEYLPQFRYCYQQEIERKDDHNEGVINLNFQINKNGKVSKVNIKSRSKIFTRKGQNCVASVLKIIDFPRPKGGGVVDVVQPLNFSNSREKI
jgi:hypothetical protein